MTLQSWMKQPTTVAGLAGLATIISGVLSGTMTWQHGLALATGAVVAIVLPDNTQAQQAAPTAVQALEALAAALVPHMQVKGAPVAVVTAPVVVTPVASVPPAP